jgi:hypothetical protein
MRNPFRHNRREEGAARAVAPERRGYRDEGQGYEEGGGPGARGSGRERAGEPPDRTAAREPVDRPVAREARGEREPRRGIGWRSRNAGAATVGAVGGGVLMLARLVMIVAALIALLIALAIVLFDVGANPSNTIVEGIHEGANFFAGSFTGLITFSGKPKLEMTVNWGIALVAYLIVGAIIAWAIRSVGAVGVRFEQRHRPAL